MPRSTIELHENAAGHYYFTLSMPRQDIGFTSSAFKSRGDALVGISALRSSAGFNNRYERLVSPRKELYFCLWAHDNTILGTSGMFTSDAIREKAIRAVKRYAPIAEVVEPTEI